MSFDITAATSGTFSIGGEIKVHRLGFGSMRLTGPGIWGPPAEFASLDREGTKLQRR